MMIGVPNAVVAVSLHIFLHDEEERDDHQMVGVEILWSGFTFLLGFMLVFRNNQSFSRFWEGATLIHQIRGEWFNAVSNLIAFCTHDEAKKEEVEHFQHLLIRLSSMLYCCALQQVCELTDDTMEIIDVSTMDKDSLAFLKNANDRCEIIMQWIQRLIATGHVDGSLSASPPILSRVYQELSRGIVNLNNVRKIEQVPFPLPYAQILLWMLVVHWLVTPLMASYVIQTPWWAGLLCFITVVGMWSVMYIAVELDQPFGSDHNDLNVAEMQRDFNMSLLQLLHPLAQQPPVYAHTVSTQAPARVPSTVGFPSLRRPDCFHSLSHRGTLRGGVVLSPGQIKQERHLAMEQASAALAARASDQPVTSAWNRNVNHREVLSLPPFQEATLPEDDGFYKEDDDAGLGDLLDWPAEPECTHWKPQVGTQTYVTPHEASGISVQGAVILGATISEARVQGANDGSSV